MTTLGQLVEKVRHRLGGPNTSASALLESAVTAADTTMQLDQIAGFSRGIAELNLELVRIGGVDATSRSLTIPPYGRGYRASTAAAHPAGTEVLFNPTWPRSLVADEINGVLHELYPDLYAVRYHETAIPNDWREPIDLPAGTIGVISVYTGDSSLPDVWMPEDRWRFDPDSTSDDRPLRVGGSHRAGTPVRVTYATRPGTFDMSAPDVLSQEFTTVTGLSERVADLIALGVASRLTPFLEVNRLPESGAEARADAQSKPAGQAATTARLLYSEFRARVDAERRVLNKEHPIRVHRAR